MIWSILLKEHPLHNNSHSPLLCFACSRQCQNCTLQFAVSKGRFVLLSKERRGYFHRWEVVLKEKCVDTKDGTRAFFEGTEIVEFKQFQLSKLGEWKHSWKVATHWLIATWSFSGEKFCEEEHSADFSHPQTGIIGQQQLSKWIIWSTNRQSFGSWSNNYQLCQWQQCLRPSYWCCLSVLLQRKVGLGKQPTFFLLSDVQKITFCKREEKHAERGKVKLTTWWSKVLLLGWFSIELGHAGKRRFSFLCFVLFLSTQNSIKVSNMTTALQLLCDTGQILLPVFSPLNFFQAYKSCHPI